MQRSRWPQWILAGVASAIVALSFLVPLGRALLSRKNDAPEGQSGVRAPGSPRLGFSIERNGKITRGESKDVVLPGDRIRFTYSSERELHFALLHLSREHAEVYFPRGDTTVLTPAGRNAPLDLTVELDNRAGTDRVFGLFCEAPLQLEPVRAALQRDDDLSVPAGCHVDSLILQKKLL